MVRRFFDLLLRRRATSAAIILAFTILLGVFAANVRPDFSIEHFFPVHDPAKVDYDRFKKDFPYDDARGVVIVEAEDLWTPAGISRVAALERDLAAIEGVMYTDGLTTMRDIVAAGEDEIRTERLFPRADLPPEEIARRREIATTDPLFAWTLAPPPPPAGPRTAFEGPFAGATSIRVTLRADYASKDETRLRFLHDARKVVARHREAAERAGVRQTLLISGLPVLRSEYNELINGDFARLFPVTLIAILFLLLVTFRSIAVSLAALATILFSIVWTYGAMGILGLPLQVLTSITPIVVMIISISDTVHIIAHYKEALGRGAERNEAIAHACADSAVPCLLTEVTIACGFLTLLAVNILALWQFGVATAMGMLLTWAANVTVLPLALSVLRPEATVAAAETPVTRGFARFVAWIERTVTRRPRRVLATAAAIVGVASFFGTRVRAEYYTWDDLRPDSPLRANIETIDRLHGGAVPLAVYIETRDPAAAGPEPMLEPAAIGLMDRVAAWLEANVPEVKAASSAADYWRKSLRLFAPEVAAETGGLPPTRGAAAQLFTVFDDPHLTRDFLSHDRRTAAVIAMMPNIGASRGDAIIEKIEAYLHEEEAKTGYELTLTSLFAIVDDVNDMLVEGLAASFGFAILVSFGVFCLVLRSWRLALVALIPNVSPIALTFAFMGLAGIMVKPTTVVVFSITLTIADDDTIQYLARFREAFLRKRREGSADPHTDAALETMRGTGLPMFITACAVSLGFLALLFSNFLGLANLGALVGVSLFTAIFADMFLSPLLIMKFKPRLGGELPRAERAEAAAP